MATLGRLNFDNSYARLPDVFHACMAPTLLSEQYLVNFNADAATLIDLTLEESGPADFAEYLSGNRLLPGSEPLAMLYAGRQFGHYVPQLGDWRLHSEVIQNTECKTRMNKVDPEYALCNHLAQAATIRAQQCDYSGLERLLKLLRTHYDKQAGMEKYALFAPPDESPVVVCCPS